MRRGKIFKAVLSGIVCAAMSVSALAQAVTAQTYLSGTKLENADTQDILADMGIGWNLGNTLDATGGSGVGSETSWGCPKTTQALISKVKALGFNTVRIPVSWVNHTTGSNYTIDSEWMDRVQEVVDYCYNEDMYVILNIHHDNKEKLDSTNRGYSTDSTYKATSERFVKKVWSQIADRFEDYDYHLIFETLNEPRRIGYYGSGGQSEWWFPVNSPDSNIQDSISVINTLNQDAVDTIRSKDGYNKGRLIMCPGYAASLDGAVTSYFQLPTDIDGNTNRLVVSVHGYVPYNFAMNVGGGSTDTYSSSIKSELNSIMNTIKTNFINNGIPVVMGEFGATAYKPVEQRKLWATDYATIASSMNMPIVLWDNNAFNKYDDNGNPNSECHGYINRDDNNSVSSEQQSVIDNLVAPYKALEEERAAAMGSVFTIGAGFIGASTSQVAGSVTVTVKNSGGETIGVFEAQDGSAEIEGQFPDGEYTFTFAANYCAEKTVTVTISDGQPMSADSEDIALLGDVNNNGNIDTDDITLIKKHLKKTKSLSGYQIKCADANSDGSVDTQDITAIKAHLKGTARLF